MVAIGTRGRGSRGRGRRLLESTGPTNTEIELNKRNASLIEDFFAYFVDTWFEGNIPPKMWNNIQQHETLNHNNHLDGFHNKISNWSTKVHPDSYSLIKLFIIIDSECTFQYNRRTVKGEGPPPLGKILEQKYLRQKTLLELFEKKIISIDEFIESTSHLINFKSIDND